MRFLVIGCGRAGTRHARNLGALGHEIQLCDDDVTVASRKAKELQLAPYAVVTVDEWSDRRIAPVDGVLICTPPDTHLDYARRARDVGIRNIFVEKPIFTEVIDPSELDGCLVMPATNWRFCDELGGLKAKGEIIDLLAFYAQRFEDWRPSYPCNPVLEAGVHLVDYAWWLCGGECCSHTVERSDDQVWLMADGADGPEWTLGVDFTRTGYTHWVRATIEGQAGIEDVTLKPDNEMYVRQMQHFIDCIEGKAEPICSLEDAMRILDVTLRFCGDGVIW